MRPSTGLAHNGACLAEPARGGTLPQPIRRSQRQGDFAHSHKRLARLDAASRQQRPPSLAPAMGAWATVQTAGERRHALLATTRHPYE